MSRKAEGREEGREEKEVLPQNISPNMEKMLFV
jgi:hypothetical protein